MEKGKIITPNLSVEEIKKAFDHNTRLFEKMAENKEKKVKQ